MTTETKDKRLQLRTTASQDARLREAAKTEEVSVTEFVLASALAKADTVLADKRYFFLSSEQYNEFLEALETPVRGPKYQALMTGETVFGKEFTLD